MIEQFSKFYLVLVAFTEICWGLLVKYGQLYLSAPNLIPFIWVSKKHFTQIKIADNLSRRAQHVTITILILLLLLDSTWRNNNSNLTRIFVVFGFEYDRSLLVRRSAYFCSVCEKIQFTFLANNVLDNFCSLIYSMIFEIKQCFVLDD